MSFLIFCALLAFCFQFLALSVTPKRWVHLLTLGLLEALPLGSILYYAIARPHGFFFDWLDNVIFGAYMAGAILLGCGCAWAADLLRKLR